MNYRTPSSKMIYRNLPKPGKIRSLHRTMDRMMPPRLHRDAYAWKTSTYAAQPDTDIGNKRTID